MSTRETYAPGVFCWVDLMTTDASAAKVFYAGLFGWTFIDDDSQPGGVYTMFSLRGHTVAGMGQMSAEMMAAGRPATWNSYIASDDLDALANKVGELGGAVVVPPMGVGEAGRLAFFTDPEGAVFASWQAGRHCGSTLVNEPGAPLWNELATRDMAKARAFYTDLCGWSFHASAGEHPYTEIKHNGRSIGGARALGDGPEAEIPPHWIPYFAVADINATASKISQLGGAVLGGPIEISVGKFVIASDPQGAMFMVMQLSVPEEPA